MPGTELKFLDALQTLRTPFGDAVMPVISAACDYGIIWIALAVLLLCFKKHRRAGIVLAAALLLELLLGNCLLKPLFDRPRPCDINIAAELLITRPKDGSFPSGHTASSFAAVSALFLAGEKHLWKWALPAAILIAFSRLYLYVHYPTDILGGILLGVLCGVLAAWTAKRVEALIDKKRSIPHEQ